MPALYLISVFAIATCGLVYELLTGTLASYLLGDSVTQFSTVIGTYLFAMGIGSYLSRFIEQKLLVVFVQVELIIAIIGGFSAATLFVLFEHVSDFRIVLYSFVMVIGILVGLEIPLVMRILRGRFAFKDLVSRVFTFDYIGALFASLLFPLVLVPHLGLLRTAFLFGMINALVALVTLVWLRREFSWPRLYLTQASLIILLLALGFAYSPDIMSASEKSLYPAPIVYSETTDYQRLVVTRQQDDIRLYLNGNLQFSSRDEYRYHEALVHVGLAGVSKRDNVLVLGGGDGMAIREILRYDDVKKITLVDLDPAMTQIFSSQKMLRQLNADAFQDKRVHVINDDAFRWLKKNTNKFDFVVIDFPDPANFSLGKLYTSRFYEYLRSALTLDAAFVVQSTSPLIARKSFWCVEKTIRGVGFATKPYHVYVPSFGEWGFIIGHFGNYEAPSSLSVPHRFLSESTLQSIFDFPPDMDRVSTDSNHLNNQSLVRYFEEEWSRYAMDME